MEYSRKSKILALCAAGLFALGLAACGEGDPQQQSSNPAATESSDAAAMPESTTNKPAE